MMVTYFVQADVGGPVKIGRSTEAAMRSRLSTLQTGNPDVLVVRGAVRGNHEATFHRRWHDHRLRGEWFEPIADMVFYAPTLVLDDGRQTAAHMISADHLRAQAMVLALQELRLRLPDLIGDTLATWDDLLEDEQIVYENQLDRRNPEAAGRLKFALSSLTDSTEEATHGS